MFEVLSSTVNGSPERAKKFCERVQPPNAPLANLLLNFHGVCQTYDALNELRMS